MQNLHSILVDSYNLKTKVAKYLAKLSALCILTYMRKYYNEHKTIHILYSKCL